MRILAMLAVIFCVCLLLGCGGGGSHAAPITGDTGLLGTWLDIMPPSSGSSPNFGICWPTNQLIFSNSGAFSYEGYLSSNTIRGSYRLADGAITFTRDTQSGTPEFFGATPVSYAFMDKSLALSESTVPNGKAMRLAQTGGAYHALLKNEWLLIRQLSPANADLPVTTSVRLVLTDPNALTLTAYNMMEAHLTVSPGALLVTKTGHIGLRLQTQIPATTALFLLGTCALDSSGGMQITGPNGMRSILVARQAPNIQLLGAWQRREGGSTYQMVIGDDGAYREDRPGGAVHGQWRIYASSHLAVSHGQVLRALGWRLSSQTGSKVLATREWTLGADDIPTVTETVWEYVGPAPAS